MRGFRLASLFPGRWASPRHGLGKRRIPGGADENIAYGRRFQPRARETGEVAVGPDTPGFRIVKFPERIDYSRVYRRIPCDASGGRLTLLAVCRRIAGPPMGTAERNGYPMFIDARGIASQTEISADLCIVGAGAAGITIARALARSDLSICLARKRRSQVPLGHAVALSRQDRWAALFRSRCLPGALFRRQHQCLGRLVPPARSDRLRAAALDRAQRLALLARASSRPTIERAYAICQLPASGFRRRSHGANGSAT